MMSLGVRMWTSPVLVCLVVFWCCILRFHCFLASVVFLGYSLAHVCVSVRCPSCCPRTPIFPTPVSSNAPAAVETFWIFCMNVMWPRLESLDYPSICWWRCSTRRFRFVVWQQKLSQWTALLLYLMPCNKACYYYYYCCCCCCCCC